MPSQFATMGLHDYWFASSSENIDLFATWGASIDDMRSEFGLGSSRLPIHSGHFYTFLYVMKLGLKSRFRGVSYVDYTLVRWRNCVISPGPAIQTENLYCDHIDPFSWERRCNRWQLH